MIVSQTDFTKGLLDPTFAAPQGLTNPNGAQASKRFDVYRNNVASSLSDALEMAFPIVRKLVGDAFFRAMAGVYLRKHPPKSPLMMFYGTEMPQFLSRFEPAKPIAYLPDIAKIELAMRHAYHAKDAAPINSEALGALDPDTLMGTPLTIAPSVHVITSDHPIYGIYRANIDAGAPKPVAQAESVIITRAQFDPEIHQISAADAKCVVSLQKGEPLGVAMTQAGDGLDLGATLGLLLRQNSIISLT